MIYISFVFIITKPLLRFANIRDRGILDSLA